MTVVVAVEAAVPKVDLVLFEHTAGFLHVLPTEVLPTHESKTRSCDFDHFRGISQHDSLDFNIRNILKDSKIS